MKFEVNGFRNGIEELYSLFNFYEKALKLNIFEENFNFRISSNRFFNTLLREDYIDIVYIKELRKCYGDSFVSAERRNVDFFELEKFLINRESKYGNSSKIHKFLLYHWAKTLNDIDSQETKYLISSILKNLKEKGIEIETLDLIYVENDIRKLKIEYYNKKIIEESLEGIKELTSGEIISKIIENLEKIFLD